jgi:hypothetical protein
MTVRVAGALAECEVVEPEYAFAFHDYLVKYDVVTSEILRNANAVDDLNIIICTADLFSLFSIDEMDKICSDWRHSVTINRIERAFAHLHIVLTCSYADEGPFLRSFPMFVRICDVNHFEEWAAQDFISYASAKFTGIPDREGRLSRIPRL